MEPNTKTDKKDLAAEQHASTTEQPAPPSDSLKKSEKPTQPSRLSANTEQSPLPAGMSK